MSQVSEVQIKIVKPRDGLVGFASLVLDGKLYLSSIGIFTKLDGTGFRLTYPTKKVGMNDMQIYHPINKEASEAIEEAVISKANEVFSQE
jgi:stage V sporulation protein G